jgi:RNA polymerase sigma-70 factor (ECF subfamily)
MPTEQIRADVDAARAGDEAAFARLVEATYADVFLLAARLTGNHHDAFDVVQDAYLRAYRGLIDFRSEARFSTWLHRITVNCAKTLVTRRNRYQCDQIQEDVVDANRDHHPECRLTDTEFGTELLDALEGLPPNLRAAVVLRDIFDLPHSEIGNQLGISATAAKVRLHRGRKRLRAAIETSQTAVDNRATEDAFEARYAM